VETLEQVVLSNAVVATTLALLASAVGLTCRRPALVHSLWLLVLIKLITPPIWQVEVFQLPSATPPASAPESVGHAASFLMQPEVKLEVADLCGCQQEANEDLIGDKDLILAHEDSGPPAPQAFTPTDSPLAEIAWNWPALKPLLWSIWLAGTLGWLLVAGVRVVRFQLLLRWAEAAPADLQERVQLLAECLGLARVPVALLVPGAVSPMIWPIGLRPRLLLPQGLLDRLTPEQGDTLLTHELAHLRRRDHWVRALELLVTGLYWWHPVVWWGRQAIREAEEECCDAWVMWVLPASSRAYASALMEALDFLAGARLSARPLSGPLLPPTACGLGQFQTLKRRLTMILTGTTPRALSRLGFLAVLGLGFLMPVLPTWGRADGDDDEKKIEKNETISKDLIKKLTQDALKKVDVDAIKKEVRDALDKDLNVDLDLGGIGELKIDLNLDLDELMENLNLDDPTKVGAGNKDLSRARAEIQRALAQVERAKAQFARAQAVLQKAQAKLADLETAAKANPDKLDKDKIKKKEKVLRDLADKPEWKTKRDPNAKPDAKVKTDGGKGKSGDSRKKDDDLERRLDKLMREVQDLSRDLKRRKATDKNEEDDEDD